MPYLGPKVSQTHVYFNQGLLYICNQIPTHFLDYSVVHKLTNPLFYIRGCKGRQHNEGVCIRKQK